MLDRQNYKSAIPQLEKAIDETKSNLNVTKVTITKKVTTIEENQEELTERVETAEGEIAQAETDIAAIDERVETAEGNLDTIEEEIGDPDDTASASGSIYARVKNVKNVADGAVEDIEEEVARAQAAEQTAQQAASSAQEAAEAAIEANYRKYNAITLTDAEIATQCAHGYSQAWARGTSAYYQGACAVGDVLLIYVTKSSDNTIHKLLARVTTASEAGQATTAEVINYSDNINAYFWHDGNGAHIKSGSTGFRTDLTGDKMSISDGSTEVATFSDDTIELGKNDEEATISLCGGVGQIQGSDIGINGYGMSVATGTKSGMDNGKAGVALLHYEYSSVNTDMVWVMAGGLLSNHALVGVRLDNALNKSDIALEADEVVLCTSKPQVDTDYTVPVDDFYIRNIKAGTEDLTAGTSDLATGSLYFVYE